MAPFLIAGLLKPGRVAWQDFRPAQGLFTVKMRAEPIAHDSKVERVGSYTITNHPSESLLSQNRALTFIAGLNTLIFNRDKRA